MTPIIVVDTNILVRPFLTRSSSLQWLLDKIYAEEIKVIFSPTSLDEFVGVLNYPRITKKYHIKSEEKDRLIKFIYETGQIIHPQEKVTVCRDPKDNMILEIALAGKASYIITSDKDLLILKKISGIPIITPEKFHRILV